MENSGAENFGTKTGGMKFAVLSYPHSGNFGDEIQSIAAARLLPRVDAAIPREYLRDFSAAGERYLLVMNGWFAGGIQFPPADHITPLYISFHIAQGGAQFYTSPECIAHFRKHEPIGCRDRGTTEILRAAGVDAYCSKCLTLTLARRQTPPAYDIAVVDMVRGSGKKRIARLIGSRRAVHFSHAHGIDALGDKIKSAIAAGLLRQYERAELVLTSRLHCALPCLAMGVPVMYFGPSEYRTAVLSDLGVPMHRPLRKRSGGILGKWYDAMRFRNFVLHTEAADMEAEKTKLIADFQQRIAPFI